MLMMTTMMMNADEGNCDDHNDDDDEVNLGSKWGVWPDVGQEEGRAERFVLLLDLW